MPFRTYHDAVNPVGYLMVNSVGKKLVFIPDTGTMDKMQIDADIYCMECNYESSYLLSLKESEKIPEFVYNRIISTTGHMEVGEVMQYISENIALDKKIILHHIGSSSNLEDLIAERLKFHDVRIAKKGSIFRYE